MLHSDILQYEYFINHLDALSHSNPIKKYVLMTEPMWWNSFVVSKPCQMYFIHTSLRHLTVLFEQMSPEKCFDKDKTTNSLRGNDWGKLTYSGTVSFTPYVFYQRGNMYQKGLGPTGGR